MWVGEARPVSEDPSDGVGVPDGVPGARTDCQFGMPRQAAYPMATAPNSTPAATVSAGPSATG